MSIRKSMLIAGLIIAMNACTWIKLTDSGAAVAIVNIDAVGQCEQLGEVTSSTQSKIVVNRSTGKVQEELFVLARNEAASRGADTLVAQGAPANGRQSFNTYRCRS